MLEQIPIFSGLSNAEISKLELFCQERYIKSSEVLFGEWDDASALYIVKEWKLKVYKDRSDGEITLWFVEKGGIVWEMAIFEAMENTHKKRMASVKAAENTYLIVIMNYSIMDLSKKYTEIYEKILKIIKERREMNDNF